MWTEEYLIESFSHGSHNSVTNGIGEFPFGSKMQLPIRDFFLRSQQEDLTLCDKPTNQMLHDITAPPCLRCHQFMDKMEVLFWMRKQQTKASTSLFFHSHEQMLAVVNGSAQVTMVSPLYSDKLPADDNELLAISRTSNGKNNKDILVCCGINLLLAKKFSNVFDFYLVLSQVHKEQKN